MISIRAEILRTSITLIVPVAVAAVFPYRAIEFSVAEREAHKGVRFAFTELTEEVEAAAVKAAKSVWRNESAGGAGRRQLLSLGELPEESDETGPILGGFVPRAAELPRLKHAAGSWLPSVEAAPPEKIPVEPRVRDGVFSREELLRPF